MAILFLIIILCQEARTTIAFTRYAPQTYSTCQCEKGDRGEKGYAGFCPADCGWRHNSYARNCLGPGINLERLAQSIRQLIIDTKKISYQNARTSPCVCPATVVSKPLFLDYNMYTRLKGDKGDTGASCSSNCIQSTQSNVQVFSTLQAAMDASFSYPDHTYVHIVNAHGRLQGVFIRVHGRLVQLRLDIERALSVPEQTLSIPKPKCAMPLPCPKLRIFALGPYIRKMCNLKLPNVVCSKLSDYDDLCERVSVRHQLKGFYRAFMSTSTQWLANLFAGVCINAKIINMKEETLFDTFEDIFAQKPPRNEILNVQGLRPQFQYWWHGSLPNGTASSNTCLDWSHQNSNLSGIASRIPNSMNGLFHHQYVWPCSISDSNMGILCIETNCDKRSYYKL